MVRAEVGLFRKGRAEGTEPMRPGGRGRAEWAEWMGWTKRAEFASQTAGPIGLIRGGAVPTGPIRGEKGPIEVG